MCPFQYFCPSNSFDAMVASLSLLNPQHISSLHVASNCPTDSHGRQGILMTHLMTHRPFADGAQFSRLRFTPTDPLARWRRASFN